MTLDLAALNSALADTEFANHLHHLTTVDSTQNLAHDAARTGARAGVWIADEQTAGRGRGAHTWHSPHGSSGEPAGLYMTALTSPPIPMQSTLGLSFRTAVAVQAAIAEITGLAIPNQIDIRWPNDLVIPQTGGPQPSGPSRKVGGILIEQTAQPALKSGAPSELRSGGFTAMLKYAVIGIGINLNQLTFPPDLEPIATSLRRELPRHPTIPREPLAAAILRNLHSELHHLTTDNDERTTDNSLHSTWLTGKRVRVEPRPGGPGQSANAQPGYTGTTAGLNRDGFLLVHGDDGQLHTVLSGGLREL
jgi:BirA family biotin operon repressor/biotin-[acetyl-CoA-carboxylase] ligase